MTPIQTEETADLCSQTAHKKIRPVSHKKTKNKSELDHFRHFGNVNVATGKKVVAPDAHI